MGRFFSRIAVCLVWVLAACGQERAAASTLSAAAQAKVNAVLTAYERIRGQLASDQLGVESGTSALEEAARAGVPLVPESLRGHLTRAADAAKHLSDMPKTDAAAVRRAFGELSRPIVELVRAERSLATGRHLFECGMAEGYKFWVQRNRDASNPYMGTRMPGCGTTHEW